MIIGTMKVSDFMRLIDEGKSLDELMRQLERFNVAGYAGLDTITTYKGEESDTVAE